MNKFLIKLTCRRADGFEDEINMTYDTENERIDEIDMFQIMEGAKEATGTDAATIDFIYKLGS